MGQIDERGNGSRREARRQDRRDAILAVAAQSFLTNGYAGTTMSAIAATLGGSKGTLWSYFPCKEALFAAFLERATAAYRGRLSEIFDPCGDLRATLTRFCASLMERVMTPETIALHRLVVAESGRFPEIGRIYYERGPRITQTMLTGYLEGVMARGLVRRDDAGAAARALIGLCMASYYQQVLTGWVDAVPPEQIEREIDRAVVLFLRAYALDQGEDRR
ncbi:TetR/AcrR family transcriptional regulator [Sphingobium sp. AN641]|uniref:TetR/AcrR family transcriptional regulator n=1 Tax=Sphingobium sp. AN641 TaxID=3133443 RepID=UPI0030BEE8FA